MRAMMLATLGIKILKSGHFKEPEMDIVCRIGWEWEREMIFSQFGKESRKYQSESKESKKSEISEQEERPPRAGTLTSQLG